MNLPIRVRLTAWYVALLALILAVLGAFLVVRLRADLIRSVDQSLDIRAAQIALGLESGGQSAGQSGAGNGAGGGAGCEGEFQDISDASLVGLPQGESGAQLLGSGGVVQETSGDPVAEHPLLTSTATSRVFAGYPLRKSLVTGADNEPFRILAVRLPSSSSCTAVLVVATSLDDVRDSVNELLLLLLIAGPVALVAAGAGGWWLARRALRPVSLMTREAEELSVSRLDERIEVPRTSDELQRLASTLNDLLDRLQGLLAEKRRFVADASHELRTPLAAMRAELDVTLRSPDLDPRSREALESTDEEVVRMHRIVENLLTLARIDEGELPLLREPVDLREAATNVLASLSSLVEAKHLLVDLQGEPIVVDGDRARLEQVLVNLVGNAVTFSPADGVVTVSIIRDGTSAVCTVTDMGHGIDAALLPHVFDRFVRGDPARTGDGGSGLGLAICREIMTAHAGRIWVDSRPGRGASFSFSLPAADAEEAGD